MRIGLSLLTLCAVCSCSGQRNPLPSAGAPVSDAACSSNIDLWGTPGVVIFGSVTSIEPRTDPLVSTDGEPAFVTLSDCAAVVPALDLTIQVGRELTGRAPRLEKTEMKIRLASAGPVLDPHPLVIAGEMTWQPGGEPGEALVVGQQLGLRVLGQHPDGYWLAARGLFTVNKGIEFQKGSPCNSLADETHVGSDIELWSESVRSAAQRVPAASLAAHEEGLATVFAGDASSALNWAAICISRSPSVDLCTSDRECANLQRNAP